MLRLIRLGLHFAFGFIMLALVYTRLPRHKQAALAGRWSHQLLSLLAVELQTYGHVPQTVPGNTLVVANHVSWLDIIALSVRTTPRFIAKREILAWPIIGWMVARAGTLFIDRTNRRDASRVNQIMASSLQQGDCLCVFPEGTTTNGFHMLPFKSSLFESALLASSQVQPVALRYLDADGNPTDAPSYSGNTTLWQSLGKLLRHKKIVVELHYLPILQSNSPALVSRFALSAAAQSDIAQSLKQWPGTPDRALQTPACHQAEVR